MGAEFLFIYHLFSVKKLQTGQFGSRSISRRSKFISSPLISNILPVKGFPMPVSRLILSITRSVANRPGVAPNTGRSLDSAGFSEKIQQYRESVQGQWR